VSVLLVDALNLFTRHFVANPAMSEHGHHVGGIVGFLNGIRLINERFSPSKIFVIWESGGSPRRRALLPDYKSKRRPQRLNRYYDDEIPDTVQGRDNQISVIVEILKNTPICQMYVPECEADDVIGYMSRYCFSEDKKIILSSDKDFYQLLSEDVVIYSPTKKKVVTHLDLIKEYRISAENFCLAKSMCGDSADNIPGVKGAGFKTIAKRFPKMICDDTVTIDEIIDISKKFSSEKRSPKVYSEIIKEKDTIRRNWDLIYLDAKNLSYSQVKRISDTLDTFDSRRDKISTMRTLIREGIKTFDVDRFFLSFNSIRDKK
jgi:DNA polymerase-1